MNKKNFSRRKLNRTLKTATLILLLAALAVVISLRTREAAPPTADPLAPPSQPLFNPAPVAAAEATPTPSPTPTPEPTPVPDPEFYTLSLIGDCTLAEDKSKRGWGTAYKSVVGDDYAYPFKNTKHIFEDDYMTLANLECTLTDNWYDTIEWFGFLAPAAYANILTEGNVDFVTLANNHTMDYGPNAYGDMLRALDSVNMPYAGENETYIFQRDDGLIVGVYCLYNEKQPTKALLDAGLKKLKDGGAQLTIAALHWGVEGAYSVSELQTEMGHYAIDAGFNVVYGSHPHRLEPVEKYNNGVIFYSMANWSFGGHTNPDDYDTAIAQFTVKLVGDEVSIESINMIPCSISSSNHNHPGHSVNDNCLNDYCPTPYEEGSEDWDRVMSKLDGTYEGADYTTNYQSIIYGT